MPEETSSRVNISCSCSGLLLLILVFCIVYEVVSCAVDAAGRRAPVDVHIRMQDGSVTNAVVEKRDINRRKGNAVRVSMPDGKIIETWQENVTVTERTK